MKGKILIVVLCVILFTLLAWAPWITKDYAERTVSQRFISQWQGVADGCGFNCDGCGVKESHRALFGYYVKIEYACGMPPSDFPVPHQTDEVFVSFLGTVHGLQNP